MVNTFIIVPDIEQTAKMLDKQRLGKQRLEAKQLIDILERYDQTGTCDGGWSSHPALRSWKGYTNSLKAYFNIIVNEWISRGCQNTMKLYPIDTKRYRVVKCNFDGKTAHFQGPFDEYCYPFWVSFPPLYMSHQAALCRKNPEYYSSFLREELKPFLTNGYLWPSNVSQECYTNWNFSYHESLACGCPPEYRLMIPDILRWCKEPLKNPKTDRMITQKSEIYKEYMNSMKRLEIEFSEGNIFFRKVYCGPFERIDDLIKYFESLYQQGNFNVIELVYYFAKVSLI